MSGEQLDKILKDAGFVKAEIARLLGVPPQSVNQSLNAQDVKTGFLEDLCRVLNKDMNFFYDIKSSLKVDTSNEEITNLRNEISKLNEENNQLREELRRMSDPEQPKKESEVYRMWMEYMRMEEQRVGLHNSMFEYYKQQKEG